MAESFLFNIAERVLEKIALLTVKEVQLVFTVENQLRKLQETMSSIKAVLLDAERQQHQNEKLRLCIWKLRDIFYDAEDVVDEFQCEARRKQMVKHPSTQKKVTCLASCSFPFSFSVKMGYKIKEINQRLDEIAIEWERFNLGEGGDNRRVIHRETHSFVNSSDVIGRDAEREDIVNLLIKPTEGENIPVIPIVGIGGLGKTTLAQYVYNDKRVAKRFPLKIWVCVSEEFNLTRLLKLMIQSINKEEKCDDLALDALQTRLRNLLDGKKFLLVLDDVWNEDRVKWIELRDLLMSMSLNDFSQSKVIVTTRNLKVASVMSSIRPYELKGLPYEDCLTLFRKWAFNDGGERQHPNLTKIGDEIVKKCKGVPLAVRTLGSLLYSKVDEHEWISIRDSEIWRLEQSENDILPVLKLSYNHLPSHLQRCLTYLSLYKKDHLYYSDDVIHFWMANGLLEHPKLNQEWEDIGNRYLNELWSRCFIQDVDKYTVFCFSFKLHDLIHDLALGLSQKECKIVYCQTERVHEKVRHLSFSDDQLLIVPHILKNLKPVRTVIVSPISQRYPKVIDQSFINFCVSKLKYLRALDLSYSLLAALPNSIGTLKHLRYLSLLGCNNIQELPSSFCKLQSLLKLRMYRIPLLQLPDSILSFAELRYLEISIKGEHLKEIRPGCWTSLQHLTLSDCDNSQCLFEGLQYLTSLRTLYLRDCFKLVSLPRSLKALTKLENLVMLRCKAINLQMELEEEEDKDLHLSLKTFSIWDSDALTDLPRLLLERSASSLEQIRIGGCYNFGVLPEWIQNLTSLQKLEISYCNKLLSLPNVISCLTALQQLIIRGCRSLSKRCRRDWGEDWPKIAHIEEVDIQDF